MNDMSNQNITTTTYGTDLLTSPQVYEDFDQVRADKFFWKAQPSWPTDNVKFSPGEKSDRRILIETLMDEQSSPELQDIGYALLMCNRQNPCKSPLCNYCRSRLQTNYQALAIKKFAAYPKKDIYFLTLLDDLTDRPLQTIPSWITSQRSVLSKVFTHHFEKQISVFGAFEVDVKHPSKFGSNIDILEEYGLPSKTSPAWMPHYHAIIGLNGVSIDEFRRKLSIHFPKTRQITLCPLWNTQAKDQALSSIARYCFKFKYKYAVNLGSHAQSEDGIRRNYDKRFDDNVLRTYAELIHQIKGSRTAQGVAHQYNSR
jgi:hypothetical protein